MLLSSGKQLHILARCGKLADVTGYFKGAGEVVPPMICRTYVKTVLVVECVVGLITLEVGV